MGGSVAVGVDIGTSSLKVTVGDLTSGHVVKNYHFEYEGLRSAAPGVVYVAGYAGAVARALAQVAQEWSVACVALSAQMYSLCEEREDGVVAYQWNSLWERDREMEPLLRPHLLASGCQVDVIFGAYKAATMQKRPGRRMLPYGLKEYLLEHLTGRLATDCSTASASGLFDVTQKCWNLAFLRQLGLEESLLPDVLLPQETVGRLKEGLFPGSERVTVAAGFGDGPAASYACKNISNFCGNLGTSMAARVFTRCPDLSGKSGLWNYAVDRELYLAGGISSNSCSVLNWAREQGLLSEQEQLDSGEICFFPWLHGERMPYWSSELRGAFTGLSITDSRDKMAAAIVKGVAFTFVRMAKELAKLPGCGTRLVLAGGGTNLSQLVQTIAGCLDSQILLLSDADYLCATGTAMCAAENCGAALAPDNEIISTLEPTGRYLAEYQRWSSMGARLAGLYTTECSLERKDIKQN